jgi:hypothetical protein
MVGTPIALPRLLDVTSSTPGLAQLGGLRVILFVFVIRGIVFRLLQ